MVVSKTKSGRYFASVQVAMDGPERPPPKPEAAAVGVDVGLKSLLVTSDGSVIEPPKYLEKSAKKMAWLQRKLSRCQKGSAGRKKMGLKVARQHEKVAKQRADFLHKTSRSLVDSYGLVGIEYLNGRGLVQNHRLARAISDAGWGEFRRQLVYKGQWDGAQIVVIDRFFSSSRRCSACGYVLPELKLSVREWDCPVCGRITTAT